jgi:hypothetical protein
MGRMAHATKRGTGILPVNGRHGQDGHGTPCATGILPVQGRHGQDGHVTAPAYAVVYAFSICFFTAACAAASRAMGTR